MDADGPEGKLDHGRGSLGPTLGVTTGRPWVSPQPSLVTAPLHHFPAKNQSLEDQGPRAFRQSQTPFHCHSTNAFTPGAQMSGVPWTSEHQEDKSPPATSRVSGGLVLLSDPPDYTAGSLQREETSPVCPPPLFIPCLSFRPKGSSRQSQLPPSLGLQGAGTNSSEVTCKTAQPCTGLDS